MPNINPNPNPNPNQNLNIDANNSYLSVLSCLSSLGEDAVSKEAFKQFKELQDFSSAAALKVLRPALSAATDTLTFADYYHKALSMESRFPVADAVI